MQSGAEVRNKIARVLVQARYSSISAADDVFEPFSDSKVLDSIREEYFDLADSLLNVFDIKEKSGD